MNRNLWLVLFGAISVVSLMIANKAGRIYNDGDSEVSDLLVLCAPELSEALDAVSEAFMREYPKIVVRHEVAEAESNGHLAPPVGRHFDLSVSDSQRSGGVGYSIAISGETQRLVAAQSWVDFLESPSARALLSRHGLVWMPPSENGSQEPDAAQLVRIAE